MPLDRAARPAAANYAAATGTSSTFAPPVSRQGLTAATASPIAGYLNRPLGFARC